MGRWLGLGCAALLGGCAEPVAQTFSVTVLDSPTLECTGHADGLLADPELLDELADDRRKAWKDEKLAEPPRPAGRLLYVNELETRMQAWFDGDPRAASAASPAPADDTDAGEPPSTSTRWFDEPSVVYEGERREDYLEGTFTDVVDTDETDEEAGRALCGARARARGVLSLTTDDGVAGRVRWTETTWVASEFSACEGRIECVRDIGVEGLLVD